jgi:hypothetical protein
MKIVFFLLFALFSLSAQAQCQLCFVSEAQARQIVGYLNNDSDVVLYYSNCTPSSKDVARRVKIKKAYYKKAERDGLYQVFIEGIVTGTFDVVGRKIENYVKNDMPFAEPEPIDITFVHVRSGGSMNEDGTQAWEAISLGIHLGFHCDPCIDPFQYPQQYAE